MKLNKLWAIALLLVMAVSALLTACGGAAQPTKAPAAPTKAPAKAPTKAAAPTKPPTPTAAPEDPLAGIDPSGQTITYWYQHSRKREEVLQEMIQEFNQTNKWGITVVGEYQGHYGEIYEKMLTAIAGGEVPDLVVAYQNQAASYAIAGAVEDLNPYVTSPTWGFTKEELQDFFPAFLNQDISAQLGGIRLGFPPNRSMEVMYYNEDWLKELGYDKPPETWDEFREMACKAVKQPFSKGPGEGMGYELSVDTSRFASMVFSRGGDLMNEDQTAYTLNTPEAQDTMKFLQDLFADGCATLVSERYGDQADFGAGKLLFTIGSSSGLPYYKDAVSEGANFNWSVAPLPHTTPEPVQNIYGASISVLKTTPERQLAAWLFLKWFTEPEQQAKWAKVSNYFPVRKSVAEGMKDYFAENPAYAKAFELLKYGKTEPPVAGYDVVRDLIEEAMTKIVGGADVQETLAELEKEANQVLEESGP
ncbi:MAG: ABC transporter substrate-binding protein [Chloroflexi bacterium]|nr:MAG: ABC transporter substrate-binding protein [Chloroflexota bacterium]